MMSAALLMLAGVEQTGKPAGSADLSVDQAKPGGISFAKSFNDRVSESTLLQGKDIAKETSVGLPPPGSKVAAPAKNLDSVIATPGEGRELTHAVQEIVTDGKAKNATSSLGGSAQTIAETGAKTAVNGDAAKNVAPPAVEESETTDSVSSSSSASSALPIVLQAKENVVVPADPTDGDRPFVSSASSAFVEKETESAGKTKEISSARKTAKIPENMPISKTVQKTVRIDGSLISKTTEASSREDAGPAPQGIVTGVVAPPKDDVSTTDNRFSEAIPGKTLAPPGVSPATAGVLIYKETGHETKAVAANAEIAMSSPDGQPTLTKFGWELGKAVTATVSPGNGDDNKMQSAFGSTTMVVHSVAGSMASGTAPIAVVSGNTPGEPAPTKVQIGDSGAHTAGLMIGSREQGGLGVIATPTDAMPTMLKATSTTLEVGIQDGTHGWLKVRAEMADGGVVNALVSAASSTGQEMLRRELPAITAYLQQEKVAVNAIAVHTPLVVGAEQRSSTGMDGAGGQTPQGHERGEPQQNIKKGLPTSADEAMTYQSLHGVDEDGSLSLAAYASGGGWLSVRA